MSLLRSLISRIQVPSTTTFRRATFALTKSTSAKLLPQQPPLSSQNDVVPTQQNHHYYSICSLNRQMMTSTLLSSSKRLPSSRETLLITDKAKKRLKEILDKDTFLRVVVDSGGCSGFQYKFEIDKKLEDDDIEIHYSEGEAEGNDDAKGRTVLVIDTSSLDIIRGSTLDYETELIRSAFRIVNNPQAEQGCSCGASFNVKIT